MSKIMEHITELGDGTFCGILKAHDFEYKGKHYFSRVGIIGIIPVPYTVTIKNGKQII